LTWRTPNHSEVADNPALIAVLFADAKDVARRDVPMDVAMLMRVVETSRAMQSEKEDVVVAALGG
jgi:hypothetical protein